MKVWSYPGGLYQKIEFADKTPDVWFQNFQADDPKLMITVEKGLIRIDDDNKLVEKNMPSREVDYNGINQAEWGYDSICQRSNIGNQGSKTR